MTRLGLLLGIALTFSLVAPVQAQVALPSGVQCNDITAAETKEITGQATAVFIPEISLPGFNAGEGVIVTSTTLGEYIRSVFILMVWSVGVLAVVMVIYGGIKWVAAAGNPGRINDAKDVVTNAVIGLVIALTSVLLLNLINPQFTTLEGFNAKTVNRCTLVLLKEITKKTGIVSGHCSSSQLTGSPDRVCFVKADRTVDTSKPCVDGLNNLIKQASSYTRADGRQISVDPIMMKAIILGEAAKHPTDKNIILSGPTRGLAGKGSKKLGTAYGIIQMIHSTMETNWKKVVGSIPTDCTADGWRDPSGSLSQRCAQHLDNGKEGILLQLKLMASELSSIDVGSCVSDNPTYIAGAYHLGSGGIDNFCKGEEIVVSYQDAIAYINSFNERYRKQCVDAAVTNYEENAPPGAL